ncbi:MAG: class I SAM-dependent methyltransferase, partial [Holophagales bacterium]|nr:class I SAM-dependent methyltransferase [Holophagales bacterium]
MSDAPAPGEREATESRSWIERLRRQIQKNRYSTNPILKGSTLLLRTPLYLWQFATDGFYRTTILERLRRPGRLHLTCNYTKMDRYPEIFSRVRAYLEDLDLADSPELRLLSFGCSTGEEARSLRLYFPRAEIVGVDISDWNLKQARRRNRDSRIRFLRSSDEVLEAEGPFHAIFCMAVLLRIAHRMEPASSSADVYPIAKFEEQVLTLDRQLRPGGLLVIYHTNYHLRDTVLGERYRVVEGEWSERDLVPKYGTDNRLLPESDTRDRIFSKKGRSFEGPGTARS